MPDAHRKVDYRPMTVADIDATGYIRKAALEQLVRGEGRTPYPWNPARAPHFEHLLTTDPTSAWVAEIGRTVVGYAVAFIRGDIWFLSQLFVQPDVHGLDIGAGVLARAMDAGRAAGAKVFAVVSSTSPVAQALYMRNGMFAFGVLYHVAGPVDALRALPPPAGNRKLVVDCGGWQDRIAALDADVFGAERGRDHALYLSGPWSPEANYAFALTGDGALAGYGYCADTGHLGPIAAADPADQLGLLRIAGDWLAEHEVGEAWGQVPSLNPTVMGALLSRGWRIDAWSFLKASRPFGSFDRYVPSGGLML